MAEKKIVYSIKINGVDQSIKDVNKLSDEIDNLGDEVKSFSVDASDSVSVIIDDLDNLDVKTQEVGENIVTNFDKSANSVENLDVNINDIDTTGLDKLGNSAKSTTEKIDRLSQGGEKGFKGISDVLRLFGVDTQILDNVKDSLGALGDLLDSQGKITEVAFDSAPVKKQAENIKQLTTAQQAATTATSTGAVATTAAGTASKGAAAATQLFNVALRALPFLAVIGAITAIISLYSKWKDTQKANAESLSDSFKLIENQINLVSDKYNNLNNTIEDNTEFNRIGSDARIQQLNEELKLLEINGATIEEIARKRKQILEAEIALQKELINNNNTLIINASNQISEYETLVNTLISKNNDLKDLISTEKDSEIRIIYQKQIADNEKIINDTIVKQNDLNNKRNDINLQNAKIESDINIQKQFGLKIINAQTESERKKLEVLKEQEKIKLAEEQRKLAEEIGKGYNNAILLKEEFIEIFNTLEQKNFKEKLNISLDLSDFNESVDLLLKSINNTQFEIRKKTIETESTLTNSLKSSVSNFENLIENFTKDISLNLKINTSLKDDEIDKVILNFKQKLSKIQGKDGFLLFENINFKNDNIGLTFIDKISKSVTDLSLDSKEAGNNIKDAIDLSVNYFENSSDSFENITDKIQTINNKIASGIKLTADENKLNNLDLSIKTSGVKDGVLDETVAKYIKFRLDIQKVLTPLRKDLEKEIKVGGISGENLKDLEEVIRQILLNSTSVLDLKQKIESLNSAGVSTDPLVNQSAQLIIFGEKLKQTDTVLKSITKSFDDNFTDIQNIVDGNLKGLQEKFENGGNFNFKLFLNKDLKEQLKKTLNDPIDQALVDLEKKKKEIQAAFDKLIENNPESAAQVKPALDLILKQIDDFQKKLENKVKENNKNVEQTFKGFIKKYQEVIEQTALALVDLYSEIANFQIQQLEREQEQIDKAFDAKKEILEEQLQFQEEFYDAQTQIANDATNNINALEEQLKTARGSRAEFLLKLIATEQEKQQKADKLRSDSIKQQAILKEKLAKEEEERAKKQEALERKKFIIQKAVNIAQITSDGAVAVIQALKSPPGPPATIPLAVAVGATAAVQLGIAASAQFKEGGLFDVKENGGKLQGKSHKEGGMPVYDGSGNKVAELEGEEYIVNKISTSNNLDVIETINNNPTKKFDVIEKYSQIKNNNIFENNIYKNGGKFKLENGGAFNGGAFNVISNQLNNQVKPNFNAIQNNLDRNSASQKMVVEFDQNQISTAIREGMQDVVIQASIQDIIQQNKNQIQIDDLRRV